MGKSRGIPVVMYHSVVPGEHLWARISDPLEEFEKVLVNLSEKGFNAVFLSELCNWMEGRCSLPERSIVLTFDDGYLDNWLYVFPLLRKYRMKATIFPSLEFIGQGPVRSTGDFRNPGEAVRYLNWSELTEMQNSGFVDVQSHTMTHSWEFCSPELIGFVDPSPRYNWIAWNRDKSVKPLWEPDRVEPSLRTGYPVFRFDRSLGVRRFIPDADFVEKVLADVMNGGGASLVRDERARRRLIDSYGELTPDSRGRFETDEEFQHRIDYELGASREILSQRLKKPVEFLCWPGGAKHSFLNDKWSSYGYLSASLPQGSSRRRSNLPSDSSGSFVRIPSGLGEWRLQGKPVCRLNAEYFEALLDEYMGVAGAFTRMRAVKLKLLSRSFARKRKGSAP